MTDAPRDLLAIRPMPHRDDGDPAALQWLQRVNRDPDMFTSARRVASWLAYHGGGEAIRPAQIAADLEMRLRTVRTALEALDRADHIILRPSMRIGALKLRLRDYLPRITLIRHDPSACPF